MTYKVSVHVKRMAVLCGVAVLSLTAVAFVAGAEDKDPLAGKSVAQLASVLKGSEDEAARINAAKSLRAKIPLKAVPRGKTLEDVLPFEAADKAVVDVLLRSLNDTSSGVRYECRKALGLTGTVGLDGLITAMSSPVVDVRAYAADAIGDMGVYPDAADMPLEKAVPALKKALGDKDYSVRVGAAMALSKIGERSAPALKQLIKLLDDDEWAVADAAVQAVAAADPSGVQSVPALVKVLDNRKHDLREFVCNELKAMGPKAQAAVPALIELLDVDAESWYAGKAAADALMAMVTYDPRKTEADPAAEIRAQVIGAIAQSVANQTTPFVRQDRLQALYVTRNLTCPIGPEALPALPYALETLSAWMYHVPWGASKGTMAELLAKIGVHAPQHVVPGIKKLLDDPEIKKDEKDVKLLQDLLTKLEAK